MPTKAELEAKLKECTQDINYFYKIQDDQAKVIQNLEHDKSTLNKEINNQSIEISSLIGDCSELRDKLSEVNKRNRELISENVLLKAQLKQAHESIYTLINKL